MNDMQWATEIVCTLISVDADRIDMRIQLPGFLPIDTRMSVHLCPKGWLRIPVYSIVVHPLDRRAQVFLSPYYCNDQKNQDEIEQELSNAGWKVQEPWRE